MHHRASAPASPVIRQQRSDLERRKSALGKKEKDLEEIYTRIDAMEDSILRTRGSILDKMQNGMKYSFSSQISREFGCDLLDQKVENFLIDLHISACELMLSNSAQISSVSIKKSFDGLINDEQNESEKFMSALYNWSSADEEDMRSKMEKSSVQELNEYNTKINAAITGKRVVMDKLSESFKALQFTLAKTERIHNNDINDRLSALKSLTIDEVKRSVHYFKEIFESEVQKKFAEERDEKLKKIISSLDAEKDKIASKLEKIKEENSKNEDSLRKEEDAIKDLKEKLVRIQSQRRGLESDLLKSSIKKLSISLIGDLIKVKEDTQTLEDRASKFRAVAKAIKEPTPINALRREIACMEEQKRMRMIPSSSASKQLLLFTNPEISYVVASSPVCVAMGSIDALSFVLFHEAMEDYLFIKALCVLLINFKSSVAEFLVSLCEEAKISSSPEKFKILRFTMLVMQLSAWFPESLRYDAPIEDPYLAVLNDVRERPSKQFWRIVPSIEYDSAKEFILSASVEVILSHLSLFQIQLLHSIHAKEFLNSGWTKPNKSEITPGIVALTDRFNDISTLIFSSVLTKQTPRERSEVLSRWIQLLGMSIEMNNFYLVFAIFGPLSSPMIKPLGQTWALIDSHLRSIYDKANEITSPSGKFKVYNSILREVKPELCIPFIGPILTTLAFIDDGNDNLSIHPTSGIKLPNFTKQRLIAEQLNVLTAKWGTGMRLYVRSDLMKRIADRLDITTSNEFSSLSAAVAKSEEMIKKES